MGKLKRLLVAACVAAMLCLSQSALAQSGRKSKSAAPPPPPPAAPEPEATPSSSSSNSKPVGRTSIIVGRDRFGTSSFVIDSYAAEAIRACIERLNESRGLNATGGGDMTRKDAIDRAKKGGDAYVLWVEVRDDQGADDNVSIGYSLYEPQTAKVLASGRVYLGTRSTGTGGVIVGVPSNTRRLPVQYQLRDAGREVADRVADKLRLSVPDRGPEELVPTAVGQRD